MSLNRFGVWMEESYSNDGEATAYGMMLLCLILILGTSHMNAWLPTLFIELKRVLSLPIVVGDSRKCFCFALSHFVFLFICILLARTGRMGFQHITLAV